MSVRRWTTGGPRRSEVISPASRSTVAWRLAVDRAGLAQHRAGS
ncbi:hypothetical protein OHA79_17275 [Streptomyces sp. NBC_00841]|nr:hypothetical protein [Streptomyces sp. NBC_00841]WRZ99435.1 hypothetical protein OHA79_17275 [Streptomyces sp. NBC_00841]